MLTITEMEMLRKELGLRYAMISEKTGIPVSTLQKVLSGKTQSPRQEVLSKLRDFFSSFGYGTTSLGDIGYAGQRGNRASMMLRETPVPYYGTEALEEEPVVYEEWPHEKLTDYVYTIDDFESYPEDFRVELIDGELYNLATPLTIHQEIQMILSVAFFNYIRANNGSCKVFPAGFGVRLDKDNFTLVIPDITICCEQEMITEKGFEGAPDLVVEILSPSNWKKDAILKYKKYVGAGVREYWIVDPRQRTVQIFRKDNGTSCSFYIFDDQIPVGIWDDKLSICLAEYGL